MSTALALPLPALGRRFPRSSIGWRRFARDRAAVVGLGLVVLVVLLAIFGPNLAPYDPTHQDLIHRRQPPTLQHPMGLDGFGRDILSRVLVGARVTLGASLLAVAVGVVLGVGVGMLAGFYGRWLDLGLMRLVDALLAFPYLLLAIVIVGALGPGLNNAILAIGISTLPTYARMTRGLVLGLKESDYVLAARSIGSSNRRLMWRHLLPNIGPPLIVLATVGMAQAILSASALSFLGLGAQPPAPEWGAMLNEGRGVLFDAPHVATVPGCAIVLAMLGFNLLGDGLRDTLDPRLKGMLGP